MANKTGSSYFPVHAHSQYSTLDGMSKVPDMVKRVADLGQPGCALSDHGNMSGTVQLYKACKEYGIKPFPGIEAYLLDPKFEGPLEEAGKAGRYHLGLLALNEDGYKSLVRFTSLTHTRPRFSRFPRATLSDLAKLGMDNPDDIALTTGCFFGWLQQTLVREGPDQAERVLKMYQEWFPHTFVELQHHNISHADFNDDSDPDLFYDSDEQVVKQLVEFAENFDLPILAGQDNHYTFQSEKRAHSLMKAMTYGGSDDAFPGDTFHIASAEWVREHYTDEQWAMVEEGHAELLDLNDLRIKPLDRYRTDVPATVKNPQRIIRAQCEAALDQYLDTVSNKASVRRRYHDRLDFELSIVEDLGMAGYFMIWLQFVEWCKQQHIAIEARGSANGSLFCFLLGITQVDAVKWNGDFERFLSRDRTKPPDVDMDIEDARRGEALDWLDEHFDSVQIGTFSKLGTSIDPETGEEKGSILVTWQMSKRRQCEEEAWAYEQQNPSGKNDKPVKYEAVAKGKQTYARKYGWIKSMADVQRAAPKDYVGLKQLAHMNSVYKSYGVHAAGVLLSGKHIKIEDYIPTMLVASSNTTVSQYDQDDVQEFGNLKMDMLGQTTLTIMRRCQQLMGRDDPTDFTWIPEDDPKALKLLRNGRTGTGIFHFEGYTKAKGGRELGVTSIRDAILVQALYMPGCMDVAPGQKVSQKDLYLRRRNSKRERDNIVYLHDAFEKALRETHGAVVFQEQVINIMRNLGMGIEGINKFFKVVKDSGKGAVERNQQRMKEVRQEFDDLCKSNGIDSDAAWGQTAAFVSYGFNRCATGDTVLIRSSGNQYQPREITIADLHRVWNGPRTPARDKYRSRGVQVMAHKDGRIKTDRVVNVYYQGLKKVWKITLANGMSITATKNHRHLTEKGWARVDQISVGDRLATMGEREVWCREEGTGNPVGTHNGIHLLRDQIKSIGHCEWCGVDEGSLEIAHLDGNRKNNDRSNLRLLCNSCHKQHDWDTGQRKSRHSRGRMVVHSEVIKIEYAGVQDTYDVEMAGDDHSWVGNGIVTHNSHATGYGIRSYRCAYLKVHHPLEFMTALLWSWGGTKKEEVYMREARRMEIPLLPPDVNISKRSWTIDRKRGGIRRGLLTIKGVGPAVADQIVKHAPYSSVEDLCGRTSGVSGTKGFLQDGTYTGALKALADARALKRLEELEA